MQLFAGIEGGASSSKVVLLDRSGRLISTFDDGPASNVWLIGKEEWGRRIVDMIKRVFENANIPQTKLNCLGLCLSGCEDDIENDNLAAYLQKTYPELSLHCKVASDTVGSIMTASASGGIVLIAGTGSNSLYFQPETHESVRCGGWGHMIGDYGSAYWIANRAIRYVIEDDEGFVPLPVSTDAVRKAIFEHFKIDNIMGLLTPLYTEFDKTHFAHLCAKIAELAIQKHDALALRIFDDAGRILAQHICALLPRIKCLSTTEGPLPVICVGSVFKSWSLLESGFESRFNELLNSYKNVTTPAQTSFTSAKPSSPLPLRSMPPTAALNSFNGITLSVRFLTQTSAIGAAYFAAQSFDIKLSIDFAKNYTELSTLSSGKLVQGA